MVSKGSSDLRSARAKSDTSEASSLLPPSGVSEVDRMTSRTLLHSKRTTYNSIGDQEAKTVDPGASLLGGIAYGMTNGLLVTPVLVSFAAIIFRDDVYNEYLPRLIKLILISGTVHQICFTAFSSMRFAVGSVQDAGVIFLSSMCYSVAAYGRDNGLTPDDMVTTACVLLSLSTLLLGLGLIITGKLKLASLVQYLPMPVIGGYLAYIGWFCGKAGVGFMAGVTLDSFSSWMVFVEEPWKMVLVAPGLVSGVCLYLALRRFRSAATLPIGLATILVLFFSTIAICGVSLEDMRQAGWVSPLAPALPLTKSWQLLTAGTVSWGAAPGIFVEWVAMFLVVAFSSSLDIAAVEMELGEPLDYNKELQMVGLSNMVSGASGGFTGSYIFSQTIFCLRGGVSTRTAGLASIALQGAIASANFSIISYVPKFFFGALLVVIATDLMSEWLIFVRERMMGMEYFTCLMTFFAVQLWGVEAGMGVGMLAAAAAFTASYSTVPSVLSLKVRDSTVVRTYEERLLLRSQHSCVLVLSLQGYIFFGSAIKILEEVKKHIAWRPEQASHQASFRHLSELSLGVGPSPVFNRGGAPFPRKGDAGAEEAPQEVMEAATGPSGRASFLGAPGVYTRYLVLDFSNVSGVDATAVRVCFLMLKQVLKTSGVVPIFATMTPAIERLLSAQQVVVSGDQTFRTLDTALEWCEEELLKDALNSQSPMTAPLHMHYAAAQKLRSRKRKLELQARHDVRQLGVLERSGSPAPQPDQSVLTLLEILEDYLGLKHDAALKSLSGLMEFFREEVLEANHTLFTNKESSDKLYFVGKGSVELKSSTGVRVQKVKIGGCFGELGFFLDQPQMFSALTTEPCHLFTITQTGLDQMKVSNPSLCAALQTSLLKSLCLEASSALDSV
ncbi:unnamed protein product [Chrysoparadoxa australica]